MNGRNKVDVDAAIKSLKALFRQFMCNVAWVVVCVVDGEGKNLRRGNPQSKRVCLRV